MDLERQVLLIERPETEHYWARSSSETKQFTFLDNTYFIQMAPHPKLSLCRAESQDVPCSGRLLVEVRCLCKNSCLCCCTNAGYSNLYASISAPLTKPFSRCPSSNMSNSFIGAWSSPPTKIGGQKRLNRWPTKDLAATVDNTQFTKDDVYTIVSRQPVSRIGNDSRLTGFTNSTINGQFWIVGPSCSRIFSLTQSALVSASDIEFWEIRSMPLFHYFNQHQPLIKFSSMLRSFVANFTSSLLHRIVSLFWIPFKKNSMKSMVSNKY